MKKNNKICVGTLTFHQSDNYGAVLQAYALQKVIEDLGYTTIIIDYYSEGIAYWYRPILLFDHFSISNLKSYIWQKLNHKKSINFEQFRQNFVLSRKYTKDTLKQSLNEVDVIIVGSDQVWNCDCTHEDYAYMLDFVENTFPKLSYAASFGYSEIPEKYYDKTKKLLEKFDRITVREEEGKILLEKLIHKKSEVVLDPVLLLNEDFWEKLTNKINGRYIFVYQAEKQPSLLEFAKKIAREKNCPIYIVSTVWRGTLGWNIKNISDCGPEVFLSYLKYAEVVVTNSFHGTALSILFNKEFYVEPLLHNNTNSRLNNILEITGLKDRMIDKGRSKGRGKNINYLLVNEKILKYRKKSINILSEMLDLYV